MSRSANAMFMVVFCLALAVVSTIEISATEPVKSYDDIEDKWVGDAGDAIDLFTGDLFISATDASLPSRGGLPLAFSRSYVSGVYKARRSNIYDCRLDTTGGDTTIHNRLLGVGWQMPVTKILGDTIFMGGAPETMFHDNSAWGKANGRLKTKSFAIYTNHYNTSDPGDTLWTDTLLFLDGTKWLFSRKRTEGSDKSFHGKYLRKIIDPSGNYVEFVYYTSRPLLKEIKESTGRKMWFTYNVMADTIAPTDTTVLTRVSWRNNVGDTVSVNYRYTKYWGANYLSSVVYPSGDSVMYQYTNVHVEEGWNMCAGYCDDYDSLFPGVYLLSEIGYPGGGAVEYQYAEGLRQQCAETDSSATRIFVYRRIKNDVDITEFRSKSCLTTSYAEPQEVYVWNNYTGDSAAYRYFPYYCEGKQYDCGSDSTNAGIEWIKKFDLRGQTCGGPTTPISERHFKWCDTKIGYKSLTAPGTPLTIPRAKMIISIYCGDTASIVETSMDTCTGTILRTYTRVSQGDDSEWSLDTVKTKYFNDQTWKTFVMESEQIENTVHGRDTTRQYVYWDTTNVRPRATRIGIGTDTIRTAEYQYDAYGNVTKVINANKDTVESIFDASGTFVVSSRNSQNGNSWLVSTFSSYTGVLQKVKDTVAAESTLYVYDSADRLIRVRKPLDSDSSVVKRYYPAARIVRDSIKLRHGVYMTTESEIDVFGRTVQTKQIGDSTIITRTFYDPLNRTVKTVRSRYHSDVDSAVTQVITDAHGRHRKTILPTGDIDSTSYGYRTSIRYNANRDAVKKTLIDGFGRTRMVCADQSFADTVFYRHGPFGRLQSVRNPMGDTSYTKFDAFNRPIEAREVDHDSAKFVYYDRAGNVRFVKNPMGVWLYSKYDKLSRLTEFGTSSVALIADSAVSRVYPTSSNTVLHRYTYDVYDASAVDSANYVKPHGYLTKRWEKQGADSNYTIFYYDKRGQQVQESIKLSGLLIKNTKYFYGLSGLADSMKYPDSQVVKFSYDNLGRMNKITNFVDSGASGFLYEPWGALREIRYSAAGDAWLRTRFAYDKLSRDTLEWSITYTEFGDGMEYWWGARYGFNNLGQLTTIHNVNDTGVATMKVGEFKYTYLGQIDTSFSRSIIDTNISKTQRWWYDNNAKWDSTSISGTQTKYTYASGRGRLTRQTTSGVSSGYAYDAWGNVTYDSLKGDEYIYDYTMNTVSKVLPSGTGEHSDSVVFWYDALGRKIAEKYVWWYQDSCGNIELTGGGESQAQAGGGEEESGPGGGLCWYLGVSVTYYIWQGDKVIAEYYGGGDLKNNFLYANGKQIARFDNQTTADIGYVVSDYLGNLRKLSQKGAVFSNNVWRSTDFRPFGQILKELNTSSSKDNYLYTGKEWVQSGGMDLYYFGARWYDPTTGRFISTDPMQEGTNAYSLALNNPLLKIDPWGLATYDLYATIASVGGWMSYMFRKTHPERDQIHSSPNWYRDMAENNPGALGYREFSPESPDASMVSVETITGRNQFTFGYDPGTGSWGYISAWGFLPEQEGDIVLTNQYNAVSLSLRVAYYASDFVDDAMFGDPNYNFEDALGFHATLVVGGGMGISAAGGGRGPELSLTAAHLEGRVIESVWRTPDRNIRARAIEYANRSLGDPYPTNWELVKSFYSGDKGDPAGTNCLECATGGRVHGPARMIEYLQGNGYTPALINDRFRLIDPYTEPELPR